MKRITAILIFQIIVLNLFAQVGPVLKIEVTRHYFGQILEKDGIVKCTFDFENTGTDTLKISKLKVSSPGITAVSEPENVLPNGSGIIRVTFDPAKTEGRVERYISLRTNDPINPVKQLSVSADVTSKEQTLEDKFPDKIGNLRMKSKHLALDDFKNTEIRKDTFRLLNAWSQPMKIEMKEPSAYTTWQAIPAVIQPMKQGFLVVTYDAAKSGNWGLAMNIFTMLTNDSLLPEKTISIGVNIKEDFSYLKKLPEPKLPKIEFSEQNFSFGAITSGEVKEHSFIVKNTGKGLLIIRKVKTSCGCTAAELKKKEIKPGEETQIDVKYDSTNNTGKQIKTITVICNDPETPTTLLSISSEVIAK